MKTHSFISSALAASVLICFSACSPQPEKPVEGKIKRETISFAPKLTGRILKIYVQEGDPVSKGDTLAMLDVPEVNARLAQAKGAVKATQAQRALTRNGATENQLKQLSAKQAGLREQYNFAHKSFKRAEAMFADSMMTPQAFDEAYAKYQGAQAQLEAVNAELSEARKGVRTETQTASQGQADQALGLLREAEVAYSERYIIATNDMLLETISLREGELATAGYALFNGYLPNSAYFRFTVPESRIASYQKGGEIPVRVPYTGETVSGKILTIRQLNRYADITTAYPDYKIEDAIYELKVTPLDKKAAERLLTNASVTL